jgi:hypothetical protein
MHLHHNMLNALHCGTKGCAITCCHYQQEVADMLLPFVVDRISRNPCCQHVSACLNCRRRQLLQLPQDLLGPQRLLHRGVQEASQLRQPQRLQENRVLLLVVVTPATQGARVTA